MNSFSEYGASFFKPNVYLDLQVDHLTNYHCSNTMSQIIRDANLTFRKDGTKELRGGGMIGGRLVSGKGHVTADGGVKLILHQTNDNLTDENTITLTMSNREEIE